ncbi:MAG TPA: TIGR01777 family protein [Dehalococcoidia bacterium]|nr:TIGR01777 family protein [Dehalococcoidia bacterium]HIK88295.1 TIGR01777 family protein [Dehalococcoidia bacterium]
MRILVSGGSGMVGSELINTLAYDGHQVVQLVRRAVNPEARISEFAWDPDHGAFDSRMLGRIDAAIHLGGVSIAGGRWSSERKLLIRESRVRSTRLLSQALAGLNDPPSVLIVASAVGFYGDRGEEPLTEESPPGEGFLADTAVRWEAAADTAREAGIRVVNARFGLIMSRKGGLLNRMKIPFQTALGGKLGSGRQWWPWISLPDVINGLSYLIGNEQLSGPVNFTAPTPVRNEEFTKLMAKTLSRPAWFGVPSPVIKFIFGEMGSEMMLYSQRAFPEKLRAVGFEWLFEDLDEVLHEELVAARSDRWGGTS